MRRGGERERGESEKRRGEREKGQGEIDRRGRGEREGGGKREREKGDGNIWLYFHRNHEGLLGTGKLGGQEFYI